MCDFHSRVLKLGTGKTYHLASNSHSGIVAHYKIPENTNAKTYFIELEWDGKGEYSLERVCKPRNGFALSTLSARDIKAIEKPYKALAALMSGDLKPIMPKGVLSGMENEDCYREAIKRHPQLQATLLSLYFDAMNKEGITSIGDCAFNGCSGLTSLVIPEGITSIGDYTFYGCSGLTSLVIPNSVTSIGNCAFEGCSRLTSLVIPEGVTSIGNYTFKGCSRLTSLVIPEGITSIGDYTLEGCSGLTSLVIPNSVTSIGDCAFKGCSRLTSLVIPNSVTSIGDCAFEGCSRLTSLVIPEGVTSIGNYAFYGCSSLDSASLASIKRARKRTDTANAGN